MGWPLLRRKVNFIVALHKNQPSKQTISIRRPMYLPKKTTKFLYQTCVVPLPLLLVIWKLQPRVLKKTIHAQYQHS